jgi:hypothetical protein
MASPELDDAIASIVKLMLRDEWEAGASHLTFAKRYGVAVATVRDWASHASRFIRLCSGDSDEIRDELLRNIRRIGGKAESADDYRNALAAQELRLRVHGLLERKPEPTEELSEEQLDAMIRARGYRKDTDATEPRAATATDRGGEDSRGVEGEEKGRIEGLLASDDD